MLELKGTKIQGMGAATDILSIQLPLISKEFPEVKDCRAGTINLKLQVPLLVISPDHRTQPIRWMAGIDASEVFDFLRIQLYLPMNTTPISAWLYIAHGSSHRNTPDIHEIIAPELDLDEGEYKIIINRSVIQLPYHSWHIALVV